MIQFCSAPTIARHGEEVLED